MIKQNEKLAELYEKVMVNEGKWWPDVYSDAREEMLEVFSMVDDSWDMDDPKQKKLSDAWDKAQKDWVKADKVLTKVLESWKKL